MLDDATATFDRAGHDGTVYPAEQTHSMNLASLQGEFADVVSTRDVLEWLTEAAAGLGR